MPFPLQWTKMCGIVSQNKLFLHWDCFPDSYFNHTSLCVLGGGAAIINETGTWLKIQGCKTKHFDVPKYSASIAIAKAKWSMTHTEDPLLTYMKMTSRRRNGHRHTLVNIHRPQELPLQRMGIWGTSATLGKSSVGHFLGKHVLVILPSSHVSP